MFNKDMFLVWRALGFKEDWAKEEENLEAVDRLLLEHCDTLVDLGGNLYFSVIGVHGLILDVVKDKRYAFLIAKNPAHVRDSVLYVTGKNGNEIVIVKDGVVHNDRITMAEGHTNKGSKNYLAKFFHDKTSGRDIKVRVHQLVMATQVGHQIILASGQKGATRVVNHLNGEHLENHIDNLEWTTPEGNRVHYHTYLKPMRCAKNLAERMTWSA